MQQASALHHSTLIIYILFSKSKHTNVLNMNHCTPVLIHINVALLQEWSDDGPVGNITPLLTADSIRIVTYTPHQLT